MPSSPSQSIPQGTTFNIPNEVIAYWAGNVGGFGRWWVGWGQNVIYLQNLGFKVREEIYPPRLGAIAVQDTFAKSLQGIYFWGHGNNWRLSDADHNDVFNFSSDHLNYKLGLVLLYNCSSTSARKSMLSNSPGAKWFLYPGTLVPIGPQLDVYDLEWIIRPGDQGTNPDAR